MREIESINLALRIFSAVEKVWKSSNVVPSDISLRSADETPGPLASLEVVERIENFWGSGSTASVLVYFVRDFSSLLGFLSCLKNGSCSQTSPSA